MGFIRQKLITASHTRFNFKILGGKEGRSRLVTIEDWKERKENVSSKNERKLSNLSSHIPYPFRHLITSCCGLEPSTHPALLASATQGRMGTTRAGC